MASLGDGEMTSTLILHWGRIAREPWWEEAGATGVVVVQNQMQCDKLGCVTGLCSSSCGKVTCISLVVF